MPTRILREGILRSESVDQLSAGAELFYRRLMSAVDDYGRYPKHPSLLRAALFPLRTDKITSDDITGWLNECERAGLIEPFLSEGKACIEIVNFKQRIRSQSKYPRVKDSRMSDRCPTNDGQMRTNASIECEGEYRRRGPDASTDSDPDNKERDINSAAMKSGLAFDPDDVLGSLQRMLGPSEWKRNGAMWRMRAKSGSSHKRALTNSLEDYFVRPPAEQKKIKNRGAWLTTRFEQCRKEIENMK
jgi:hypothetical protein